MEHAGNRIGVLFAQFLLADFREIVRDGMVQKVHYLFGFLYLVGSRRILFVERRNRAAEVIFSHFAHADDLFDGHAHADGGVFLGLIENILQLLLACLGIFSPDNQIRKLNQELREPYEDRCRHHIKDSVEIGQLPLHIARRGDYIPNL